MNEVPYTKCRLEVSELQGRLDAWHLAPLYTNNQSFNGIAAKGPTRLYQLFVTIPLEWMGRDNLQDSTSDSR